MKIFDTRCAACTCSKFVKLFQNFRKSLFAKIETLENLALCGSYGYQWKEVLFSFLGLSFVFFFFFFCFSYEVSSAADNIS